MFFGVKGQLVPGWGYLKSWICWCRRSEILVTFIWEMSTQAEDIARMEVCSTLASARAPAGSPSQTFTWLVAGCMRFTSGTWRSTRIVRFTSETIYGSHFSSSLQGADHWPPGARFKQFANQRGTSGNVLLQMETLEFECLNSRLCFLFFLTSALGSDFMNQECF